MGRKMERNQWSGGGGPLGLWDEMGPCGMGPQQPSASSSFSPSHTVHRMFAVASLLLRKSGGNPGYQQTPGAACSLLEGTTG